VSVGGHYNYWIAILLMMIGLYPVIAKPNLIKKILGLSLFQTGIFLFYISVGKVFGGTAPIYFEPAGRDPAMYTNSIPTALILTGIVVSVSTTAVALAIAVNIKRAYGTVEMYDIENADRDDQE
jgi:multicomponent Na+:H+ antiporter subunit C